MNKAFAKFPPKGSFSTTYSSACLTPEQNRKNDKSSETEFSEISFNERPGEKTSEVQRSLNDLLRMWEEEKTEQLDFIEKINKRLEKLGLGKLEIKKNTQYYLEQLYSILNEVEIKNLKLEEMREINKELELTARAYKGKFDLISKEINEFRLKASEFQKTQSIEKTALAQVMKLVNCKDSESILKKIKSLEIVIKLAPKLQSFVEAICKEFVPEVNYSSGLEVLPSALGQVFKRIEGFKEVLKELVNFKVKIYEGLNLNMSGDDKELTQTIQEISQLLNLKKTSLKDSLKLLSSYLSESKTAIKKFIDLYGVDPYLTDLTYRESLRKLLASYN